MPKRKKSTHKRRAHYTVGHTVRKRRRMSAGAGAFKAVSNPVLGGLLGGLAGIVVKNMIGKAMAGKDNAELVSTIAPVAVGFLIRKKAPYVAAGMVAVPAVRYIATASKIELLAEDTLSTMEEAGNTSFVSENLLLSDNLYLSDQDFSPIAEPLEEESVFAEYDMMNEED